MKELKQAERNSNYQLTKLLFPFKALDQAKCKGSPEDLKWIESQSCYGLPV